MIGKIASVAFLSILSLSASAQVEWLAKDYNFGSIKEINGPVTGSVRFVNLGKDATFINRVRPSCGCTGASYPTDMIQPGDTATISFTYNPQGRPGAFDKTVKVYMGPENELTVIRIMGTVIGSPTTLDNSYPVELGSLRLENTLLPVGELKRGSSRHMFLNVYNQGEKTLKPTWRNDAKALTVDLTPKEIAPGEAATFSFYLRTEEVKNNGPLDYPVVISAGGEGAESVTVTVSAVIVPDTRTIPVEQLENAPQAFLLPEFVDLGEVSGEKTMDFEFSVLNEGKSNLKVDRVYCRQEGVAFSKLPGKVKPAKMGKVKGKLYLKEIASGPFRMKVEVVTDDPVHPVRTFHLIGFKK